MGARCTAGPCAGEAVAVARGHGRAWLQVGGLPGRGLRPGEGREGAGTVAAARRWRRDGEQLKEGAGTRAAQGGSSRRAPGCAGSAVAERGHNGRARRRGGGREKWEMRNWKFSKCFLYRGYL